MKSQSGLRENFVSNATQTWNVIFTETTTKGQFIVMESIPDKELAEVLVEAFQSYSPERENGNFAMQKQEMTNDNTPDVSGNHNLVAKK